MLKNKKPVNVGDYIPYVICKETFAEWEKGQVGVDAEGKKVGQANAGSKKNIVDRAFHPEEVVRAGGLELGGPWALVSWALVSGNWALTTKSHWPGKC